MIMANNNIIFTKNNRYKYLILLFFFTSNYTLIANNFSIFPVIHSQYQSSGYDWSVEEKEIFTAGWGVGANGKYNNFTIDMKIYHNGLWGTNKNPSDLSTFIPISHRDGMHGDDNLDKPDIFYNNSFVKLTFSTKPFNLNIGKYKQSYGPGNNSIILSERSPAYPRFSINFLSKEFPVKLIFEYSTLRSMIDDGQYTDIDLISTKSVEIQKHLTFHRIEYTPFKKLKLGFSESVIYSYRGIDLTYFAPLPFHSLQGYRGDYDNILLFLDFNYAISPKVECYSVLLVDEWAMLLTFDKANRNWFGYQFGLVFNDFFSDNIIEIEYTWTDHRIYRHRIQANDYYTYNIPLGFWGGPHAEEFRINYSQSIKSYILTADLSMINRGDLTDQMIDEQYYHEDISSDNSNEWIEAKKMIQFKVQKNNIFNKLNLSLGIGYLHWENAGFDPYSAINYDEDAALDELKDIEKISFYFGLNLNM